MIPKEIKVKTTAISNKFCCLPLPTLNLPNPSKNCCKIQETLDAEKHMWKNEQKYDWNFILLFDRCLFFVFTSPN